jgi:hypothetical protein
MIAKNRVCKRQSTSGARSAPTNEGKDDGMPTPATIRAAPATIRAAPVRKRSLLDQKDATNNKGTQPCATASSRAESEPRPQQSEPRPLGSGHCSTSRTQRITRERNRVPLLQAVPNQSRDRNNQSRDRQGVGQRSRSSAKNMQKEDAHHVPLLQAVPNTINVASAKHCVKQWHTQAPKAAWSRPVGQRI